MLHTATTRNAQVILGKSSISLNTALISDMLGGFLVLCKSVDLDDIGVRVRDCIIVCNN